MNIALVLSGGIGSRTGYSVPKQYLTINDKPVIMYVLENLQSSGLFDEIDVVCSEDWKAFVSAYARQYNITSFKSTIPSGETRNETVLSGIRYLASRKKHDDDHVCIVESVRPIIPHTVLKETIDALRVYDCATGILPSRDSLFSIDPDTRILTGRAQNPQLYAGVTPIAARLKDLLEAADFTDRQDESIPLTTAMMCLNKKIKGIVGSSKSIKITTADDFSIVSALLRED